MVDWDSGGRIWREREDLGGGEWRMRVSGVMLFMKLGASLLHSGSSGLEGFEITLK